MNKNHARDFRDSTGMQDVIDCPVVAYDGRSIPGALYTYHSFRDETIWKEFRTVSKMGKRLEEEQKNTIIFNLSRSLRKNLIILIYKKGFSSKE